MGESLTRRVVRDGQMANGLGDVLIDLVEQELLSTMQAVAVHRAARLVAGMRENRDVQLFVGLAFIDELDGLLDEHKVVTPAS